MGHLPLRNTLEFIAFDATRSPGRTAAPGLLSVVWVVVCLAVTAGGVRGQVMYEKLTILPNEIHPGDHFARSLSMRHGMLAVGASGARGLVGGTGAAYLFEASTGIQRHKLFASDGASMDSFGRTIALDDEFVIVGAPRHDGQGSQAGAVYAFNIATGVQIRKLEAADPRPYQFFGDSVAIADGLIAVGAYGDDTNGYNAGAAYLFDAATGEQLHKLLPADGHEGAGFGLRVALDEGVLVVGASADDVYGTYSGSAYLFDTLTGEQIVKLIPADGQAGARFGDDLAIASGTVAIGAPLDSGAAPRAGAAYLFDAHTGEFRRKIVAPDPAIEDYLGDGITLQGDTLLVGAPGDDDTARHSGSLYVFDADTVAFQAKMFAEYAISNEVMGLTVALDGDFAVGGTLSNAFGIEAGSAYQFDLGCPADLNGDGLVDTQDFVRFLNAWSSYDPLAN